MASLYYLIRGIPKQVKPAGQNTGQSGQIIGPGATRELNLQPTNIKYRPAWSETYFSKVILIIANLDNY